MYAIRSYYDDKSIRERIFSMFQIMLKDNVKARIQQSDGTYIKKESSAMKLDSQQFFYMQAYQNARAGETVSSKKQTRKSIFSKLKELLKIKS